MRPFLAPLMLIPFVIFSGWVLADVGYMGFWRSVLDDPSGVQITLDLFLANGMLLAMMYGDAQKREVTFWPWIALTLLAGSIGPLFYFTYTGWLARSRKSAEQPVA